MSSSVLVRLDQMIADHTILSHPFYQALALGELGQEEMAIYAWVYYPHVEAFPRYIEVALKQTQDPTIREILLENLHEEIGEEITHPELWLRFASGMGVSRQEVTQAQPVPEVEEAIQTFFALSQQSPATALCALYTYESQQPELCRRKIHCLQDHFHIDDPQTLSYFLVHEEADLRHREDTRRALLHCISQDECSHDLFEATQTALDAHWKLLNGVCRQAGLCC